MKKLWTAFAIVALLCAGTAFGQTAASQPAFQAGVTLGTDAYDGESWTRLGFTPDLAFGKFGVGLDLTLHFQLYPAQYPDQAVIFYPGDWMAPSGASFGDWASLYLSKILYVRYGQKGQDPLFVKAGSISDFTLGNGFIMGNYSNMSFYPQTRFTGLDLGLDGAMFNFPWVGFEIMTSNVARFDVVGTHVYSRPLVGTDIPVVKNLQVGLTLAADTNPATYYSITNASSAAYAGPASVAVYGLDAMLPVLDTPLASVSVFTEGAMEPNSSLGYMLGSGGKLFGFFTWGAQLRLLGAGFIPDYFDTNYDLYRADKAYYMSLTPSGNGFAGWFASLGTSLLGDKLTFTAGLDGPFAAGVRGDMYSWPHLRAVAHLGEGLLPGVYFDASYEKYALGSVKGFFEDLADPTDAIAGLSINYRTGSSILTLLYNARWVDMQWKVTSSLQATVKF